MPVRVFRKWRSALTYQPGDSFIHRLNPLTKLAVLIAYTGAALAFGTLLPGIVLWAAVLAAAVVAELTLPLLRGYLIVVPFIAFVVVTDAFFGGVASGTVLYTYQLGFLTLELYSGRLLFALAMGFRLLALSGIGILFIVTTSYTAFIRALRSAGFPASLSFSLGTAFRSMGVLTEDAKKIMDAQRSRGMEFDRDLLTRNRNKLTAVTVPMAVTVLRRSKSLTAAMESRGFSSSSAPSVYRRPEFSRSDALAVLAVSGVIAVAWFAAKHPVVW